MKSQNYTCDKRCANSQFFLHLYLILLTSFIMKTLSNKIFKFIFFIIIGCLFNGCTMMTPVVKIYGDTVNNYRYFYITPTGNYTSSSGVYSTLYGSYGGSIKSINPSAIISGILLKKGFIQVNEINPLNADKTMVINFSETGRRPIFMGYSIEVTIQFISAETQEPICTCTAEGMGDTEADDVRIAIQRALESIF